jgi:hypothetical protein
VSALTKNILKLFSEIVLANYSSTTIGEKSFSNLIILETSGSASGFSEIQFSTNPKSYLSIFYELAPNH